MPATRNNRLLEALSPSTYQRLLPHLQQVPMPVGTPLFESGHEPKYVYFITSGIASTVTDMENGDVIEVGLYGNESLPGTLRLLGPQTGSTRCFMQLDGTALRIGYKELDAAFHASADLHARILEHVQYEAVTLAQLAACNRMHGVEERLARWLLMVADRTQADMLPLTQEFLSEMLGTRRPSVNLSAGILQRAGLIRYQRGHVEIADHKGLQQAACECYPVFKQLQHDLYAQPNNEAGAGRVNGSRTAGVV